MLLKILYSVEGEKTAKKEERCILAWREWHEMEKEICMRILYFG
jgi:hypothetical protein